MNRAERALNRKKTQVLKKVQAQNECREKLFKLLSYKKAACKNVVEIDI